MQTMINPNYDHESEYHDGTPVEADARAWLGVWKSLDEVPDRHRLARFEAAIDAADAWTAFFEERAAEKDWSQHTRDYVYGKAWREWEAYCLERSIHPACPTPNDVETHLDDQQESLNTNQTLHDCRFRPLFLWWEWMRYSVDYPVTYNPSLMAVLLGGATEDAWDTRVSDRLWQQQQRSEATHQND